MGKHHKKSCSSSSSSSDSCRRVCRKSRKCKKSCSSSSSSSSCSDSCGKVCYVVKKCKSSSSSECCDSCPEKCPVPAHDLCCKYGGSVVTVQGQTLLTTETDPSDTDLLSYYTSGTGFFVKSRYIVCPAHLVLIPPTVLADYYRYPFVSAVADLPALGVVPNTMTQVSRILVNVPRVCGSKGFTYQASLVGVDGAADVAVLKICDDRNDFNKCNPQFPKGKKKCCKGQAQRRHPFKYAKICHACCGEKVYAMGDFNAPSRDGIHGYNQMVSGVLSDKSYTEHDGWVLPTCIVVDFPAYNPTSGMPIFDVEGRLLGMQLTSVAGQVLRIANPNNVAPLPVPDPAAAPFLNFRDGQGGVLGISVEAMKRSVNALICGVTKSKYCCLLETVADLLGNYLRIKKSYLGVAYELTDANTLTTTPDYTGTSITRTINVDPVTLQFATPPKCKHIEGVQVQALAGGNASTEAVYVPGVTNPSIFDVTGLADSPLIAQGVVRGDVITEISVPVPGKKNKCLKVHLGDLCKQGAPSKALWFVPPSECSCNVLLKVRTLASNFDTTNQISVAPLDMPKLMDFPWYAINDLFRSVIITTGLQNPKIGVASFKAAV